ncbi:MAG: DegT/DnrJ/EryC1/StrS family aminotransferase [Saprospirales bacterium]|nr:MAG: DegT/DnrJ/EryC1/StrS family aminotransferase [Saprospirales bacterium]
MSKKEVKILPDLKTKEQIPVTKPFLPPLEEYKQLLEGIWERNWLTNNGPLVEELEQKLKSFLRLDRNLLYVTNGTIALQLAIKALKLKGEIITTPFSYVATTSSIVWEGCTPVFVDIEPERLTIDPAKIEEAITDNTSAILATHVYGLPCFVDEIQDIADRHGLKVIYDAAHAFGCVYRGKSLYDYGDISTASFHATKLFHTVEGGAVMARDQQVNKELFHARNFGHAGPENFHNVGINGKNSEVHAAMGIVNLRYINQVMSERKKQALLYRELLAESPIRFLEIPEDLEYNHAYVPVIFPSEKSLLEAVEKMAAQGISPRRYFYPGLDTLNYVKSGHLPMSEDISKRVLCLPVYEGVGEVDLQRIVRQLLES